MFLFTMYIWQERVSDISFCGTGKIR